MVDLPNVRIEAEAGKTIHWRPSSKPGGTKLLLVHKAENFHLKGFTLDGDNRINTLINLFHHCPGATLEDLKLQGFKQYGIWVTNCEGGETSDRYIRFNRLLFVTNKEDQTALFFSIQDSVRDSIPKNQFFTFHDCEFKGPGAKIKTPNLATLQNIEWPPGIQPVQGQK